MLHLLIRNKFAILGAGDSGLGEILKIYFGVRGGMESRSKKVKTSGGYSGSTGQKKRSKSKSKNKSNKPAALNNTKGGPEMICYELAINQALGSSFLPNPNGQIQPCNILLQGTAVSQREKNRIEMRSIRYKAWVKHNPLAIALTAGYFNAQRVRLTLVYDLQTNGTLPSLADVFGRVDQNGAIQNSGLFAQSINVTNRDRFVILADDIFWLPETQMIVAGAACQWTAGSWGQGGKDGSGGYFVDRFVKLKGLNTMYKSNGGTIGDITTGGLYLVATSDGATDTGLPESTQYLVEFNARLVARDF